MSTTESASQRQTTLLKAAARASKAIATILDPYELFQRTVDIICDEFGFYYAGVFLVDETGQYAVLKSGRGEAGKAMIAENHKLAVGGNSMIGMSIQTHQGRIALDVGEEAVFFINPHLPDTRSEMALPLVVGGDAIGALTVQSTEEAAFKDEDIIVLQSMADQLAVAIQNSNLMHEKQSLLRQIERRSRLLQAANQVGKEVTSILDLDELLPQTVDIICEAYGFYYTGIFLVDETGEWAVLRAGYGEAGKAMLTENHRLKVGPGSMIGAAISFGEARIALDVGEERVHFKNPHLPNTRSEMALPLKFGSDVIGAVTVQSVEERAFSQDDITTLLTMAEHLAVAISNARTLEALKEAHADILRNSIFEALTTASTEAIHWIGNKTLPISLTVSRLKEEIADGNVDVDSLREDLEMIDESTRLIIQVKEQLIGAVRDQKPRPVLLVDAIRSAAIQRGVTLDNLKVDMKLDAAYTVADSTQFVRALGNLLENASEAGATEITLTSRPAEEHGKLVLVIADNGSGMSTEMLEKAWAPFYSTKNGHHGLGLPAALHVISQMQGRIDLTSAPGSGTRITLWLPLASVDLDTKIYGAPSSVLLLDDDDEWAGQFSKLVKVTRQTDAKKVPNVELVLLDESSASFSVDEVLAQLEKAGALAKTVVITASMDVDRISKYMRGGVKDVRQKAYSLEDIAAMLQ